MTAPLWIVFFGTLLGAWIPAQADVQFVVDTQQDVHPISRYIYGINQRLEGNYADLTFTRLGGNRWTAYNWENNASNAGSDWHFQNDSYLGGGDTPGGAVMSALQNASSRNAGLLLTIPINGYVAADKNGGGDVRYSGSLYLKNRFRQGVAEKNDAFSLMPDLTDEVVYQDEFVHWVKTNHPYCLTDPNRAVFFSLDNEPDLWSSTHAEVHPAAATYAELLQKTIDYAAAIKKVIPSATVFGPVSYGWYGYLTLQDAPDHAGRDFLDHYLYQLSLAELSYGYRLVNVLDVHWYPEAQGGGSRITEKTNTPSVVAARLQAPRSLWDPAYTETSWITQWSTYGPIALLPRLAEKIATNYPGTKLAITEYNYGGGNHISGGLAQADVLGVFGREGLFAANEWPLATDESFIAGGFRMFRNVDGLGGHFGDTSVKASTSDVAASSVYASTDSANPNLLVVVALNKTAQPLVSHMQLRGIQPNAIANIYQLTGASSIPQPAGRMTIADPSAFVYALPAYSVTTLRIAGPRYTNAPPSVAIPAASQFNPVTATTSTLTVLGADDGGEAGLTYTWSLDGVAPAPVSFSINGTNAAKITRARFVAPGKYTFRATISDGKFTANSHVHVTVSPTLNRIDVNPAQVTLPAGGSKQFLALATDQFGGALTSRPTITWSLRSRLGTISSTGLYNAPGTPGSTTLQAASGTVMAAAQVTVVKPLVPAAPCALTATSISRSQITLTWSDRSNNEAGFAAESSTDGKTFKPAALLGANVRTINVTGLSARTTYCFRVRAYNNAGFSGYSERACATTKRR